MAIPIAGHFRVVIHHSWSDRENQAAEKKAPGATVTRRPKMADVRIAFLSLTLAEKR